MLRLPQPGEYPPYFENYFKHLNKNESIFSQLEKQAFHTYELFSSLPDKTLSHRYAEGKWTVKEIFGHCIDVERILAFRVLSIARGEEKPLSGFDEAAYVQTAHFNDRSIKSLLDEYKLQRAANLILFSSLDERALSRKGSANGFSVTAYALVLTIAGHEVHHYGVLREKYEIEKAGRW